MPAKSVAAFWIALRDFQGCADHRSSPFGLNFQSAAELPQPLSHTTESDSTAPPFDQFALLLRGYAFPAILNFNTEIGAFLMETN